jgi:hypothetical protein
VSIPETLSNAERQMVFDRLWQIIAMVDAGKSPSDIRLALRVAAEEVMPPLYSPARRNLEKAA